MNKLKSWIAPIVVILSFSVTPLTRAETIQDVPEIPEYGVERDFIPPLIHEDQVQSVFGVRLKASAKILRDVVNLSAWGDHLFGSNESEYCIASVVESDVRIYEVPFPSDCASLLFPVAGMVKNLAKTDVLVLARKKGSSDYQVFRYEISGYSFSSPFEADVKAALKMHQERRADFTKAMNNTPQCD